MSDEPSERNMEALAEVLYAHERKVYVGYPPWHEARYGEPHVIGARNTCLYTARAILASGWYAERLAQARGEGAAEVVAGVLAHTDPASIGWTSLSSRAAFLDGETAMANRVRAALRGGTS